MRHGPPAHAGQHIPTENGKGCRWTHPRLRAVVGRTVAAVSSLAGVWRARHRGNRAPDVRAVGQAVWAAIIPAPTVPFVASSIRMKLPVRRLLE